MSTNHPFKPNWSAPIKGTGTTAKKKLFIPSRKIGEEPIKVSKEEFFIGEDNYHQWVRVAATA